MCQSEYVAHKTYQFVGRFIAKGRLRDALFQASNDEYRHYTFWSKVGGDCRVPSSYLKILAFTFFSILFGITVLVKVLERIEGDTSRVYAELAGENPEYFDELNAMAVDESKHEAEFASSINEARIKYLSSITLGVSDAIIELTGIYTGALGILDSTKSAGTVGLLAGISAAISMAAASYAQAKHEIWKKPHFAAIFTGVSYLAVVSVLAAPYFLTEILLLSFAVMIINAILVVAYISVYGSTLLNKSYLREFMSNTGLLLGISVFLYVLGRALGVLIHS